uniref:Amino acid transporter transmembrane domain-containing protein n=1 Tax=Acrobeloides nanus TaxID=290746 RepID=A0A914C2Y1_9BILA
MEKENFTKKSGYHWFIAGFMLVGDIVGGGVIALPTAIVQAGIIPGLIFIIIMTAVCIYTSYLLGECWKLAEGH